MTDTLQLEQQVRRLTRLVHSLLLLCAVLLVAETITHTRLLTDQTPATPVKTDSILHVRGLVVVDARGLERVWIGAPVTEPRALGKRFNRGAKASGILLFDAEGNERGGYVTFDDEGTAHFSLDAIGERRHARADLERRHRRATPRAQGHTMSVTAVAFLDPQRVISSSLDGTLRVWRVEQK